MNTEKEATKCWCPFARVPDIKGGQTGVGMAATNRHAGEKKGKDGKPRILRGNAMCIASKCMAWRWSAGPPTSERPTIHELEKILEGDGGKTEILPNGEVVGYTHGYCGLAGKP